MKEYKHKNTIIEKSEKFVELLKQNNINAFLLTDTLREYSIKININYDHKLNIFYSPKANRFKATYNEIKDPVIAGIIEEHWNNFNIEYVTKVADQQYYNEMYNSYIHIYVDGSYKNGGYGYGFVVIKDDEVRFKDYGYVSEEIFRRQNNIGGEFFAVLNALKYCKKNNFFDVVIYFDYWGISKFASGVWIPKTESTRYYVEQYKQIGITPVFVKVDAHKSIKWNEYVDLLAKAGSDLDPNKKEFEDEHDVKYEKTYKVTDGFSMFLLKNGIENEILKGKNKYGYRIKIIFENNSNIYFDIYDCKSRNYENPIILNASEEQKNMLLKNYLVFLKNIDTILFD